MINKQNIGFKKAKHYGRLLTEYHSTVGDTRAESFETIKLRWVKGLIRSNKEKNIYVVQKGDTLTYIARKQNRAELVQ